MKIHIELRQPHSPALTTAYPSNPLLGWIYHKGEESLVWIETREGRRTEQRKLNLFSNGMHQKWITQFVGLLEQKREILINFSVFICHGHSCVDSQLWPENMNDKPVVLCLVLHPIIAEHYLQSSSSTCRSSRSCAILCGFTDLPAWVELNGERLSIKEDGRLATIPFSSTQEPSRLHLFTWDFSYFYYQYKALLSKKRACLRKYLTDQIIIIMSATLRLALFSLLLVIHSARPMSVATKVYLSFHTY